mmetsp:Transcript_24333/g.96492  ORF Transcript_24333/g.96492 Transcript_24333/m.96492 type:complete len:224 (-) Transcript_24333:851-1522(-)
MLFIHRHRLAGRAGGVRARSKLAASLATISSRASCEAPASPPLFSPAADVPAAMPPKKSRASILTQARWPPGRKSTSTAVVASRARASPGVESSASSSKHRKLTRLPPKLAPIASSVAVGVGETSTPAAVAATAAASMSCVHHGGAVAPSASAARRPRASRNVLRRRAESASPKLFAAINPSASYETAPKRESALSDESSNSSLAPSEWPTPNAGRSRGQAPR